MDPIHSELPCGVVVERFVVQCLAACKCYLFCLNGFVNTLVPLEAGENLQPRLRVSGERSVSVLQSVQQQVHR